jgi:NTE family protein
MYALIVEGGGVKGIAHAGALCAMDINGTYEKITHVAGSSAGSQVAALVAAGFTASEIRETVLKMPVKKFFDKSWGYVRNIYRLVTQHGYCSGDFMESYLDALIAKKAAKAKATFSDLWLLTGKELRITGTCLEDGKLHWFDRHTAPSMPVSKAVRISSCFPLAFVPVVWEGKTFVDGGVLRNLPLNAFPEVPGIALDLTADEEAPSLSSFTGFIGRLIGIILAAATRPKDNSEYITVVQVDTGTVPTLDFNLSSQDKRKLYKAGYKAISGD